MPHLLLFVLFVFVNSANAAPQINQWHTENGANVYFVEAPALPMVDIATIFDAGSGRDGVQWGLASFVAAMLEEGTVSANANQIADNFANVGANFSASIDDDMATIHLRALTDESILTPALLQYTEILSQANFPEDAVERVRKQIFTSLQNAEQNPSSIVSRNFYQQLFGSHPYGHTSSGDKQTVSAITRDDLVQFYRQFYTSANAKIVIVGDLSLQQARVVAEQISSGLAQGEKPQPVPNVLKAVVAKQVVIEHPSSQTHIMMGSYGYPRGDADKFPLYVGNHILGGSGLVSRISEEIREKRGLAYSAYSYFSPLRAGGAFVMGLQTKNESKQEALDVLRATVEKFVTQGPSEQELADAKKNITGSFPLKIDSNGDLLAYISVIAFYDFPLDYLNSFTTNVESVTVDQIRSAMQKYIDPNKLLLVTVGG